MGKYLVVIATLIAFLVGFAASYLFFGNNRFETDPEVIEIRDTVVEFKPSEPIVVEKIKAEIRYKTDTIIQTKPFVARIDTVALRDTIIAEYEFPENTMSLAIYSPPDSTKHFRTAVIRTVKKEAPWWEAPAYVACGAALGFIISSISK